MNSPPHGTVPMQNERAATAAHGPHVAGRRGGNSGQERRAARRGAGHLRPGSPVPMLDQRLGSGYPDGPRIARGDRRDVG